jgi:flavorubredoxin
MAGALKDLFDRTLFSIRGKVDGKRYVAFSGAGGGSGALDAIDAVCSVLKLKKAAKGVVSAGKISPEALSECEELGKKLTSSSL